jgi:hypothetical protein
VTRGIGKADNHNLTFTFAHGRRAHHKPAAGAKRIHGVSKQAEEGDAQVRGFARECRHRMKVRPQVDGHMSLTESLKPCRPSDLQAIPDQLVDIDHHHAVLMVTAHEAVNVTNHLTGLNTGMLGLRKVSQCDLIMESVQEQLHPTADRCHRIIEIVRNPRDEEIQEVRPRVLDIQVAGARHRPRRLFTLKHRRELPTFKCAHGILNQEMKNRCLDATRASGVW